jgi:hypothetical protein
VKYVENPRGDIREEAIVNDSEMREALVRYLEESFDKIRVIDELVIGDSRADIVTVTDHLPGYEIKSDADTYVRLRRQIGDYDVFFEENWLVVGEKHLSDATSHIPSYWGIICVSGFDDEQFVEEVRTPARSLKFSMINQLSILWRDEILRILNACGLNKYAAKRKTYIAKVLASRTPEAKLRRLICDELFERDWTTDRDG